MLFKLSLKNMKKSFKDYAIYFITLVLGVSVFYMFNSLDSQEAMLEVSASTKEMIKLMINMLSMISVFVAVVLGLLIVYANRFLINRRKKEFGIYMILGMSKKQISRILLFETLFIGIISLVIGLIIGVFLSQFASILVAKLFDANMTKFEFVFSLSACIKTCIYFAVAYLAVILFNAFTISKYKLIDLINANKKNEQVKMKNPVVCTIIFIISSIVLGYAYYLVTNKIFTVKNLNTVTMMVGIAILLGIITTVLIFYSISGLMLKISQSNKSSYYKGTNMFVLRQIHNKINTTVISISVICLMLFMTISALSSSLALKNSMQEDVRKMTPVDVVINKSAYLDDSKYDSALVSDSKESIIYSLSKNNIDVNLLKDIKEVRVYEVDNITWNTTLGTASDEVKNRFPSMKLDTKEQIMKISEYNSIATLYNMPTYTLNNDEYIIICNYENIANIRNLGLSKNTIINIKGSSLKPKYDKSMDGFIEISTSHTNVGIILVPDNINLSNEEQVLWVLAANYNASSDKDKKYIEEIFNESALESIDGTTLKSSTKIHIVEASVGVSTIVVFIAIYLGIVFLIVSCAILALKQLTEASDNKQRYTILRKIGCSNEMINSALFKQIAIFFLLPLILAIIHSIFGIKFAMSIFDTLASKEKLLPSTIMAVIVIAVVYIGYFMATYIGSKNIIKED